MKSTIWEDKTFLKPFYRRKRFWLSIAGGITALWLTFHRANFPLIVHYLRELSILWVGGAFLCAAVSYGCIAGVLQSLLVASGYRLSVRDVLSISLISTVANYVINFAGISGLAVKIYLMSRKKIIPSHTLSISIIHGFFTNTIAIFFIFVGLIVFYGHYQIETARSNAFEWVVVSLIAVLFVAFLWLGAFISHGAFRQKNWHLAMGIYDLISRKISRLVHRRDELNVAFENFNESMNFIVRNARQLLYASFYALADWAFMFGCLKTSFLAVHCHVPLSVITVGFCVSLFISVISIVPGGVGVMEGSMVSVFYLLGLDYEQSLVAVLCYRILYYLLPIVVGFILFLYGFILHKEKDAPEEPHFPSITQRF